MTPFINVDLPDALFYQSIAIDPSEGKITSLLDLTLISLLSATEL